MKQAISTRKAFFSSLATYAMEVQKVELRVPVPVRPVVNKGVIRELAIRRSRRQEPVSLMQIFEDLQNHFLNAFERILELSHMLETTTFHSHSNFHDDNRPLRAHIDHRISHLISWDQPFKGTQGDDDLTTTEEIETLATVLEKMLAWESKLYDQVNAGEVIKYEYQKAVSLLNKQKKQGSNSKSLAKLNTTRSHLHTRYIVEMQSAVSTLAEINCTRDENLYPRLIQLVDGMEEMWKTMLFHHDSQAKIVYSLKSFENSQLLKETSEYPYDCTIQLCGAVPGWHTQFCGIIDYQKDFISALHNWSKLSLIPIETDFIEKVSSSPPPRVQNAPIHALLIAWKNDLDQLPDEVARNAIRNFAAVTQTIMHQQEADLKTRERRKSTPKELDPLKDAKLERESVIISLKQQQKEDDVACKKVRKAARQKSLASLRCSLLEVFSAMSEIAQACSSMYRNLRNIIERRHGCQNS